MPATRLFDRAVIRLSPRTEEEDVVDFLQGLVTNDVAKDLPVYAGLLTSQGKAMFDFLVWPSGKRELLIDCEAEAAPELVKRLSLYRLRRQMEIAIDENLAVHWHAHQGDGGAPDPRLAELGQRWLAPVSDSDEAADAEWQAHRLSLGVVEGRGEMADILWLETNAVELGGVSFDKGCYVGQENTARMNWRQKVNRRLVVVDLTLSQEKRRKAAYPELGKAVDHLRVTDLDPESLPEWQRRAISSPE